MEAMTSMHDAAILPSAMAAQLTAAFADASTMYGAWLATARNDYEAMSKADASTMQRYRLSHGGRTHVEHHGLLADLYDAFFEAAIDAMPAALSTNLTSERRSGEPMMCVIA